MKAQAIKLKEAWPEEKSLIKYYEEAGMDYFHWSKNYNMHFGYYKLGMNPFKLEPLLEAMNDKVMKALNIDSTDYHLLDMGCGVGAAMRHFIKQHSNLIATGITLVPWQIEKAKKLNAAEDLDFRINLMKGDYTSTNLPEEHVNGVMAMESACYAKGEDKAAFLKESYRVLKKGGRFVMVDGFKKRSKSNSPVLKWAYQKLLDSWVLDDLGEINQIKKTMKALGFKNIKIEEISWPVAVSVAHVPFKTLGFLLKQLFKDGLKSMNRSRWNNLIAPMLTMIVGLHRRDFGYYIVSADKL